MLSKYIYTEYIFPYFSSNVKDKVGENFYNTKREYMIKYAFINLSKNVYAVWNWGIVENLGCDKSVSQVSLVEVLNFSIYIYSN